MCSMEQLKIVRLNAHTWKTSDMERKILAPLGAHIIEMEFPEDSDEIFSSDAILILSAYLQRPIIEMLQKCRVIARIGNGIDKIDIEAATQKGIYVTNVPDFCTNEVADHTMAMLLSAARFLKENEAAMRRGRQLHDVRIHRLANCTLGIIGFGRIGQAVAKRAKAFGMRVVVCDPQTTPDIAKSFEVELVDKDTILRESDYLCLLCPLCSATSKMIGENELKNMKSSAVLVNTGRGELVDEDALADALQNGVIRFAALDVFGQINVFAQNGFPTTHPFFRLDNVMLTPHIASLSTESMEEVLRDSAQAVYDVLTGKRPTHIVNPNLIPWFE